MCPSVSRIALIHLIAILCHYQTNSQSVSYDAVVIFGDSNSDNGNVYNQTNRQFPPAPFFQGRFSNGPVWAERLNISRILNNAYGGATTDNDLIQSYAFEYSIPVPGVRQQITSYSKSADLSKVNLDRTLYVIWAGGNNYLRNQTAMVSSITNSLSHATKDLLTLGVKHIIIFNQPPLQIIPFLQPLVSRINVTDLTYQYNTNLSANIAILQNEYKGKSLKVFDLSSLIYKILINSTSYGILNTVNPCWNSSPVNISLCSNANSHVFFDDVHFTSRIHQLIADEFHEFLRSSSGKRSSSTVLYMFYVTIMLFSLY